MAGCNPCAGTPMTNDDFDCMVAELLEECGPVMTIAQLYCHVLDELDDMILENKIGEDEATEHMRRFGDRLQSWTLCGASPSKVYH